MNIRLALPLIAVIASLSLPASAQKMYRCGSTYQQQPCGGGQEGKVIGHGTGTASPSVASPANLHPACAQRGAAAQKIKWIREAGNTQQQQEEAAGSPAERELVAEVYRRPGTSGEVRAAVEADCMAERERAAKAGVLPEASAARNPSAPQGARPGGDHGTAPAPGTMSPAREDAAVQDAARKAQACGQMNDDLTALRDRQRAGGDSASMDSLRERQQKLSSKVRAAGC